MTDYKQHFQQLAPEVVVDMIAMTETDAQNAMATFKDLARRVVVISSQDVYRARDILWRREIGVIEKAGLVTKCRSGKEKVIHIEPNTIKVAAAHLSEYEKVWGARFNALEKLLEDH